MKITAFKEREIMGIIKDLQKERDNEEAMTTISMRMSKSEYQALKVLCAKNKLNVSSVIRRLIRELLSAEA